ncbi:hypothetical protein B4N89_04770 [Embleya scabrispora]|uniref:Uncharacterized protein n=1 Tax=Embleya scabrispora TaxID=159449 RepID=A0A1T3NUN0_9ACTN|nr:hypothetical protein [Embleya scabrispora]OPC80351.1 hypothetical protein B4N89_04770 [Embleya scabrispora]
MTAVTPSGDEVRLIRITTPGREPLDVTRAEPTALVHESRMYPMRTLPAPSVGRGLDSGG